MRPASREQSPVPRVVVDVEAFMINLIKSGEEFNEAIESMKSGLPSHQPRLFQKACNHRLSIIVQGSDKCTLAIKFVTSVPRSNTFLMLCKSYLKCMPQFQWSAIPTILKEYWPLLRRCYQSASNLLQHRLGSLSKSGHLPQFMLLQRFACQTQCCNGDMEMQVL